VRGQADVDVAVRRVLDNIALRERGRSRPVAAIGAEFLRNGKFACAIEREDFICTISSKNGKFSRCDGVGLRRLNCARKFFVVLLHHEDDLIQRVFHRLRRERIIGNEIQALQQVLFAQDGDRLTRRRSRKHRHVAATRATDATYSIVGRDGLRRLDASGRADDDGQVVLIENLEVIGEDSRAAIAVVGDLVGAAADCHLRPSRRAVFLPRMWLDC